MDQNVPVSVMNRSIMDSLERGETKKAADASTGMTRTQLREGSFAFKILPPEQATNDMLVPSLVHDKPMIYWELEPDSPGSKWVPFQTVPSGEYIWGSRYVIPMARVVTQKYEKDLDELRTYKTDLRKVLTDNSIKDGLAEIDGKFIALIDAIVTDTCDPVTFVPDGGAGVVGNPNTFTGKVQWMRFNGGLTRENFAEAKKMMLRGSMFPTMADKFHLRNNVCLMNEVTAQELLKLRRDAAGGDVSEEMLKDGLVLEKLFGVKMIFTIKSGLVPTGTVYFFAAPEFLGKCFYLTDWTMYMKKEAYMVEMFSYWLGGMAIGNVAGVCRADFAGIV
jgi:hypothetical protein